MKAMPSTDKFSNRCVIFGSPKINKCYVAYNTIHIVYAKFGISNYQKFSFLSYSKFELRLNPTSKYFVFFQRKLWYL